VPATKAAGLQGLRIHDLRHTAVALWIAAGATPKEVAVRAGHTSVSFTWTATATRRSPGRSRRAGAIQ
jgi:integrase